ncbi:MAG: hypothetical protein ACLPSM_05170, partial [Acidimicrobiales bacterium]
LRDREGSHARTSAPGVVAPVWHSVLKVCGTWTPLVATPMQAVITGPRRAPRSILSLTSSSRLKRASRAG